MYDRSPYPLKTYTTLTIVDIKNALLSHFLSCSTFGVPDDLALIKIDIKDGGPDFIEHKESIVRYGLDELVKVGLLAQIKSGPKSTLYVLNQPLNQLNQTTVITPITALMLADLVNGFTKQTGEQKETGYVVNKLSITDYDIATLCRICHTMLSTDGSNNDEGDMPPSTRRPDRGGDPRG